MNQYGQRAREHWQRWLPKRYSQLEDPDSYFSDLGEEILERVEELSEALAGKDSPAEEYMQSLGRLNMARSNAETQAMQELALLEPEET